jgi:DNA-binding response OmpR family regulator
MITWLSLLLLKSWAQLRHNPSLQGGAGARNSAASPAASTMDDVLESIGNGTLSSKERHLLEYFINNPGRVISREELLCRVWGHKKANGSRTVDTHVWKLRRKLAKLIGVRIHLQSIRKEGYVLTCNQDSGEATP